MATRSSRAERRWRRIVEDWRRSGLSAPRYAEGKGLSAGMIYAWSSRLQKQDAVAVEVSRPATPGFLPVAIIDNAPTAAQVRSRALEVVLPGGEVIRVSADTDLSHLGCVVAALRGGAA